MSVVTHSPLLRFCSERDEPVGKAEPRGAETACSNTTLLPLHLLTKRLNLLQRCNSRNSTQEGFCLLVFLLQAGRQKSFKRQLSPATV